jgi:hypothetical protein
LGYTRIFKVVKNTFWSFHSVDFIHTNSLVQKSASSDQEVAHRRRLNILHCSLRAPRKKTTGVHVRHIRAEPSRLSRSVSRTASCAEEYSTEYSRFNPSEPPDVQNRFPDRFSPFLTHFQQSQTSSLLFWAFRIYLQCSFCQIQLPEGDIVIQRAKWLQKMHKHSSRS